MQKQKWGTHGRACTRLKANLCKTLISSIVLANVRSLENKLDYIRLELTTKREVRDGCGFVLAETWQNDSVTEDAVSFNGLTTPLVDRITALSGKTRGGSLCIFINKRLCGNANRIYSHCGQ